MEKHSRGVRRLLGALGRLLGPFLGLGFVILFFAFFIGDLRFVGGFPFVEASDRPAFLTVANVKTIAIQTAIIATCGIGMTLVIIGGGIDLSIGSGVALVAVVVALVFNGELAPTIVRTVFLQQTWLAWTAAGVLWGGIVVGPFLSDRRPLRALARFVGVGLAGWFVFAGKGGYAAAGAGVLAGVACGLLNGLLVTRTRVVPFIITLGTMQILRGAAELISRGQTVNVDADVLRTGYPWLRRWMELPAMPDWIDQMGQPAARILGWLVEAPGVYMTLAAGVLFAVVLAKFPLGRYVFAVGSNEQAARLSGISIAWVKRWMYSLMGLMVGLAGVMQFARLRGADPSASAGLELDVIAAVVIGGGSLRGGEGSILGAFVGAFIIGFLRNGCVVAGIPTAVQRILIGAIVILAVAMDELRHRRR